VVLLVPAVVLLVPTARAGTPLALALSHSQVRSLDEEFRDELHALDEFAGRRSSSALGGGSTERPGPWRLYGRLGPLKFQNDLDSERSAGLRFGFGSTGPRLTGRINMGIHRRFD
jgi:hypothetical protein